MPTVYVNTEGYIRVSHFMSLSHTWIIFVHVLKLHLLCWHWMWRPCCHRPVTWCRYQWRWRILFQWRYEWQWTHPWRWRPQDLVSQVHAGSQQTCLLTRGMCLSTHQCQCLSLLPFGIIFYFFVHVCLFVYCANTIKYLLRMSFTKIFTFVIQYW